MSLIPIMKKPEARVRREPLARALGVRAESLIGDEDGRASEPGSRSDPTEACPSRSTSERWELMGGAWVEAMFTLAKIKDGRTYLDQHLSANDYYAEKETVKGVWIGRGAERLGILGHEIAAGDVAFERFRRNLTPEGKRLTARGGANRNRFIDIQCGAPKSISIMAVTMDDARLQQAHTDAVTVAFAELEKFAACQANTLTERIHHYTGNLISARFRHTASRALDPQLHDHLVSVAATYDERSERWKALTEYDVCQAIRYAGKVYQNELAKQCLRLGYDIRPVFDRRKRPCGFELEGVSDEMIRRFSKRRVQIEKGIEAFEKKHGRAPTTAEIHAITTRTRDPKLQEITTDRVLAAQRAQLSVTEFQNLIQLKDTAISREGRVIDAPSATPERECILRAIAHIYERECIATGHGLLAEALNQNPGFINLERLSRELNSSSLLRVPHHDDVDGLAASYVTPHEIRRERWVLAAVSEETGRFSPLAVPQPGSVTLSESQDKAVRSILDCRDRVANLRGAAGTGKTTVLQELDRALQASGKRVLYCAPTASAADLLRKDGLADATTLAGLLQRIDRTPVARDTVIVMDEAGLCSMRDGAALLRTALLNDWRVVLVGDTRQHSSVEAGDFLRLLESCDRLHRAELNEIRRQDPDDYRAAIQAMADGCAQEGLARLDRLGCITESGPEYLADAATTYVRYLRESGVTQVLGVAPTHAEGEAFTASVRDALKREGLLRSGESIETLGGLGWTRQQKLALENYSPGLRLSFTGNSRDFHRGDCVTVLRRDEQSLIIQDAAGKERRFTPSRGGFEVCRTRVAEFSPGDRVLIEANDPRQKLINGQVVTLASVSDGILTTDDGRRIDTARFNRFSHGYVVTSHKSQGKTARHVVIATSRWDAKTAYVACSRGKSSCMIHTPEKADLLKSIPTGDRRLGVEAVERKQSPSGRNISPPSIDSGHARETEPIPEMKVFRQVAAWPKSLFRESKLENGIQPKALP